MRLRLHQRRNHRINSCISVKRSPSGCENELRGTLRALPCPVHPREFPQEVAQFVQAEGAPFAGMVDIDLHAGPSEAVIRFSFPAANGATVRPALWKCKMRSPRLNHPFRSVLQLCLRHSQFLENSFFPAPFPAGHFKMAFEKKKF